MSTEPRVGEIKMKKSFCFNFTSAIAFFIAIYALNPVFGQTQSGKFLIGKASIKTYTIQLPDANGQNSEVAVNVALDNDLNKFSILSALRIIAGKVYLGGGETKNLFDESGRVIIPNQSFRAILTIEDYFRNSKTRAVVLEKTKALDELKDKTFDGSLEDLVNWKVQLEITDFSSDDGKRLIDRPKPFEFSPSNKSQFDVAFLVDVNTDDWRKLNATQKSDFRLRFFTSVEVTYLSTDYQIYFRSAGERFNKLVNDIQSTGSGDQKLLIVPVGNGAKQKYDFTDIYKKSVDVTIRKRSGYTLNSDERKNILDNFFASNQLFQQTTINDENQKIMVLMNNGISINATKGEIKKIVDDKLASDESKLDTLLETLSNYAYEHSRNQMSSGKTDYKDTVDGGFNILDVFGADGKYTTQDIAEYKNTDDSKTKEQNEQRRKQMRNEFRKNLSDVKRMFEGSVPVVSAISFFQLSQMTTRGFFDQTFSEQQTISGGKEIAMTVGFGEDNVVPTPIKKEETKNEPTKVETKTSIRNPRVSDTLWVWYPHLDSSLGHNYGKLVGTEWVSEPNEIVEKQFHTFGPYVALEKGIYRVFFTYTCTTFNIPFNDRKPVLEFQVARFNGISGTPFVTTPLDLLACNGALQRTQMLEFSVSNEIQNKQFEFRIYLYRNVEMRLQEIRLVKVG
ncbi:MAG: hypothetical protein K1X72_00640 [Pyrinomonadaceae bacterium]|nr:hypothetical protein [Pyrinomonadaceae bacterium]